MDYLEKHLGWMKEEYENRQKWLKRDVENMENDSNFERNAINSLAVMMDLKSRISELEKTIEIMKLYKKEENDEVL